MYRHLLLRAACVATALLLSTAASGAESLKDIVTGKMKGVTCPDMPAWTCVSMDVPVDHRANSGPTVKIEYAVSFARKKSKGVLFYLVGGPGEAGRTLAEEWISFYDERLRDEMDIVFFNQRGIGPDHGVICKNAQTALVLSQPSIDRPDEAIAIARKYATDCPAEFKSQALVKFLATDQAIRDLELFRQAIGSPKVSIYGYSYGTQFAQQYAKAFPTAVKGVVIDGVVDLSLDYAQYDETYVLASESILTRVLKACDDNTDCKADMNGAAAAAVYQALSTRTAEEPIVVDFVQPDGQVAKRELTGYMLASTAQNALYTPEQRVAFLRALAAAAHENLQPLLRLSYDALKINPASLEFEPDPRDFSAAYYAITCSEYGEGTADGEATARQIMKQAKKFAPKAPRLLDLFYMERLVCAFWPKRGPNERPKPFAGGDFPTLIVNADADPITPLSMAESVFTHVQQGAASMIVIDNGPHVSWSYDRCIDDPVYKLLIDGEVPNPEVTRCELDLIGFYAPLTLMETASAEDSRTVALAAETEIDRSPELRKWDRNLKPGKGDQKKGVTIGCDLGGTVTASGDPARKEYRFDGCSWWPGLVLNGKATRVGAKDGGKLTLDLDIGGDHNGKITYRRDIATSAETMTGNYDGKAVSGP